MSVVIFTYICSQLRVHKQRDSFTLKHICCYIYLYQQSAYIPQDNHYPG